MRPKCTLLLLLLLIYTQGLAADAKSWDSIKNEESDLVFLEALASFALSADVSAYGAVLSDSKELSEVRRAAALSVVLDQWIRKDPGGLEETMKARWDEQDEMVHRNYVQLALMTDPSETTRRLFKEDDPYSEYRDELMYELIRRDPESVAGYLAKREPDETNARWANALVRSWMNSSADDALEWATANRELIDLTQAFSNLLNANDADSKAKLGELWDKLPDEARTVELQTDVANRLVYSDPELALKFIEGLPGEERYRLTHRVMERLAESKSPKAAELMRSLPSEHLPNIHTVKTVLMEWALREPEKATEWADTLEDQEMREKALARINTVLAMSDPELAIQQALATPEGTLRRTLIRNTALSLAKQDLTKGFAWVDSLPESAGKELALKSMAHLTDRMPAERLFLEGLKLKPSPAAKDFVDQVFNRWCQRNIKDATEWYLSQDESSHDRGRDHDICYQLVHNDPELAIDYILSDSMPLNLRKKTFGNYLNKYNKRPEMLEPLLAEMQFDGSGELLSFKEMGRIDPNTAMRWAVSMPEQEQSRAMIDVANSWARKDPVGLATYIDDAGELDIRYNYARITEGLASQDVEAAAAWADNLESQDHRHYATLGLALHEMKSSPATAFQRLEKMDGKPSRAIRHSLNLTYGKILERWAYYDPAGARSALEESSLTDKEKSKLLKSVEHLEPAL